MSSSTGVLEVDPLRALSLDLSRLGDAPRRATLRALLALSSGAVRVEGAAAIAAAPEPTLFALTHHNAWEAVLAPATLVALRRGRLVRFLVDWMLVDQPWSGWLVRQIRPIPVYGKRAALGRGDGRRPAGVATAMAAALEALAVGDDVGIYPEARRNPDPWRLAPGSLGVGVLALRSGVAVLPVGVDFPARDRLMRTPRLGRFVLRAGDPLDFGAEHAAWRGERPGRERLRLEAELAPAILERVLADLGRLSRKLHLPRARRPGAARRGGGPRGVAVAPVTDGAGRAAALRVIAEVYRDEKGWLRDADAVEAEIVLPAAGCAAPNTTWLLACDGEEPAGVVRLAYEPPLELPAAAGVALEPGVDLEALAHAGRFAEIGRLMIRPSWRRQPAIVTGLMRAAVEAVVARGCTHLLTTVFEDDPHSPYRFHTRVLGFQRIGTHRTGELATASRRILLVLDLASALGRLRAGRGRRLGRLVRGRDEWLERVAGRAEGEPSPDRDVADAVP